MGELVDGAYIEVLGDLGIDVPPFILGRDDLGEPMMGGGVGDLADLTADVVSVSATWGTGQWAGGLTELDPGRITLAVWDPLRAYDPGSVASGLGVTPGRVLTVRVDGSPVWSGYLDTADHDVVDAITTLRGLDRLALAAGVTLDVALSAGAVTAQMRQAFTAAGWTEGTHYRITSDSAITRAAERFTGTLREALARLATAALADVWCDRTGLIVVRPFAELPTPDVPEVIIGEGGVPIASLIHVTDRRIVNRVVVDPIIEADPARTWDDDASQAAHGVSGLEWPEADLLLT